MLYETFCNFSKQISFHSIYTVDWLFYQVGTYMFVMDTL